MQDDRFEWDDEKARSNLKKHKVSFEVARRIFANPNSVEKLDLRDDYGEDRVNLTGMVGLHVFTITFVERNNRIRIISARQASTNEQDEYFASGS